MSPVETGTLVTFGIFVAGLIYHAGQMSQRLYALEQWRGELRADLAKLDTKLDRIELLIRGEET